MTENTCVKVKSHPKTVYQAHLEPWDPMPQHVARKLPAELLDEHGTLRARPHQGHVPTQDVQELRQLIQREAAQPPAHAGAARVVRARPYRPGSLLRVAAHRPELQDLEAAPIEALWPLATGKESKGRGALEFVCPDPLTEKEQFIGCKKPGERLPMGTLDWKGSVTGREQVTVPAGTFEAVVIRAVEDLEIQVFGRSRKSSSTVTCRW